MIIRRLQDLYGTKREVDAKGWTSTRLLIREDGMGFSFHETFIKQGATLHLEYKNHLEAVLCIEGTGTLTDCATQETHDITCRHVLCAQPQRQAHPPRRQQPYA